MWIIMYVAIIHCTKLLAYDDVVLEDSSEAAASSNSQ